MYAAVNNLASTYTNNTEAGMKFKTPFNKGTGDFVALDQATGKIVWDHKFNQSPYGAASLTNDVAFTTTYDGTLWALNTKTGKVLWSAKLPAGTNTPVTIAGDTVITAGSFPQSKIAEGHDRRLPAALVMQRQSLSSSQRLQARLPRSRGRWP